MPIPDNTFPQAFTSYGASMGTWPVTYQLSFNSPAELAQTNGVIFNESSTTIASVTDGTSNTFLFGEHAKTNQVTYDPGFALSDGQWNSGRPYDTMVSTFYGPNPGIGTTNEGGAAAIASSGFYPYSASSQHPGGVNMAFCDGSVRFVKNTISSWSFNGANPVGVSLASFIYTVAPGTQIGVWQQLSTRNLGRVKRRTRGIDAGSSRVIEGRSASMSSRTLSTALLVAAISGCGGGGPVPGTLPPHGGTLVPLTGAKGFAEVVRDGPRLVVYFLDPDRKPLSPAPSDVRLRLRGAARKAVELKPADDPDPARSGGLAAAFPDGEGVSGELSAKVDGKPVSAPINRIKVGVSIRLPHRGGRGFTRWPAVIQAGVEWWGGPPGTRQAPGPTAQLRLRPWWKWVSIRCARPSPASGGAPAAGPVSGPPQRP